MLQNDTSVKLLDSPEGHVYEKNGKRYPSVTTILKVVAYNDNIVKWANHLGFQRKKYEDELTRTAREGTFMHSFVESIVDPEHVQTPVIPDPLIDYYVRKRVQNFILKLQEHKGQWETIFTEGSFVSEKERIAGTMDWYTMWHGKKTLFDFKSSKSIRDKHFYQLGGYDAIFQENGETIDQAGIILVKPDNCIIHILDRPQLEIAKNVFMRIRDYYYAKNEMDPILIGNKGI